MESSRSITLLELLQSNDIWKKNECQMEQYQIMSGLFDPNGKIYQADCCYSYDPDKKLSILTFSIWRDEETQIVNQILKNKGPLTYEVIGRLFELFIGIMERDHFSEKK